MTAIHTFRQFEFRNKANAIFDESVLTSALLWLEPKPKRQIKTITMYGRYPAVSVGKEKIHIHRLIMSYLVNRKLDTREYVNHIDGNRLHALAGNLEILTPEQHQSLTNKGRKQTPEHIAKRADATTKTRYGHSIYENPDLINKE